MTREEAIAAIRRSPLAANAGEITSWLEPCVRLRTRPSPREDLPIGASRIGGLPDMPAALEWPRRDGRPISFVCQLSIAEVASVGVPLPLPSTGWLALFLDITEFPTTPAHWRLLHFDKPAAGLRRLPAPEGLVLPVRGFFSRLWHGRHPRTLVPAVPVSCEAAVSLPDVDDTDPYGRDSEPWQTVEAYVALRSEVNGSEAPGCHQIMGHASQWQDDARPRCEAGLRAAQRLRPLDEEILQVAKEHWRLLLQVDYDPAMGRGWGGGRWYVWLREDHLAARAFDRCWVEWQGG